MLLRSREVWESRREISRRRRVVELIQALEKSEVSLDNRVEFEHT